MKATFTSFNTALTFSVLALLSEAWRSFLDAMFVFPVDFPDPATMHIAALIFTLLFGGWGWSLARAWQGGRSALIAAFVLNLLVLLAIPVSWLFFYCPADCRVDAGIFNLANSLNLIFGVLAAITLGLQLRSRPEASVA